MALFVSIGALYLDFRYKEASIRPEVLLDADSENFTVSLRNVGLGPAYVKHLSFFLENQCFYADKMTASGAQALRIQLAKYFFETPVRQTGLPIQLPLPQSAGLINMRSQIYQVPNIIRAGEGWEILAMSKAQLDLFNKKLDEMAEAEAHRARQIFEALVYRAPIGIQFCSITGWSCTNRIVVNCPPKQ
jgi:hypothetical protein